MEHARRSQGFRLAGIHDEHARAFADQPHGVRSNGGAGTACVRRNRSALRNSDRLPLARKKLDMAMLICDKVVGRKGEWQGPMTISAFLVCIFCRAQEIHSSANTLPSNRFEYHFVPCLRVIVTCLAQTSLCRRVSMQSLRTAFHGIEPYDWGQRFLTSSAPPSSREIR